jgi:hypothetical protein
VYSIQYFFTKNRPNTDRIQHVEDVVIKFVVSDMRQIGGFLRVSIFINWLIKLDTWVVILYTERIFVRLLVK